MKLLPLLTVLMVSPLYAQSLDPDSFVIPLAQTHAPAVEICEEPPKQPMICQDLHRLTCAAGEFDDGTGTSQDGASLQDKIVGFKADTLKLLKSSYEELLAKPESAYLREIALAAYGLKDTSLCEVPGSKTCAPLIAKNMADLSLKRMFSQPMGFYPGKVAMPAGVQDLDLLIANSHFKETENRVALEVKKQIKSLTTDEAKISNEIFPKVKDLILQLVEKRGIDKATKEMLRKKISAITYNGSSCGASPSDNGVSLTPLLVPNAFYDPSSNSFQFCNGFLLLNNSEFMLAHVIAHELAHSFDPCWITKGPSTASFTYPSEDLQKSEEANPFKEVLSCLRSPGSVAALSAEALKNSTSPIFGGGGMSTYPPGYEGMMAPKVHPLCAGDQLGEAFPDWVASEVLPTYIAERFPNLTTSQRQIGYSNVWRSSCIPAGTPLNPLDNHSDVEQRVNRMILLNPLVRKQMGCPEALPSGTKYCGEVK